jgi:leader peptidase (prepilin peptidase) / N-methyltransferase
MIDHIGAAVVSAIVGLLSAPLMQFVMRRAPIHVRYRGIHVHCMNCGDAFIDVQRFPLLARIKKQSACKTCSKPVDKDAPWFDIALALSLAAAGLITGFQLVLPARLLFVAALVTITVIDLRHYMIPTKIVYPALWLCMVLMIIPGVVHPRQYMYALAGMAASWLFFFVIYFINPKGLGFGDVRLSALTGFMTGWLTLADTFLATFLGLLLGGVVGVFLVVIRVRGRKDPIPYGPFLALGSLIAIFGPAALK